MRNEANVSRRTLVKGAAALGAATVVAGGALWIPVTPAQADGGTDDAGDTWSGKQLGFLVRTERCVDCEQCVAACRRVHETPDDLPSRRKVIQYENAAGDLVFASTSCMHCADPACATVCPAHAITKGDGGVVSVNSDRCIGCKYCFQACPFSVPHYASWGMDKCDCCLTVGVELGDKPYCVQACKFRGLDYGTLDELLAGSQGQAKQVECETGPSCLLQ